ncbi:hypothetical protein [Sphingomonas jatrophae]|uniref:Phosphatidate cytidylyltransferase n=1 Tax=Sphingomonas jatrophae TaxID=1166337 RepID=A0A1I6LBJ0_9SPHN|nr:hypothetical protein [Sphingomonas jatrophae]SFS00807.1 hypothetical protein SAMN05192580_2541 [Sphingomonas jatrophae]
MDGSALLDLVTAELAQPVDPRVAALAGEVARRHPGSLAVLFYGSCLWKQGQGLDGQMLDFYLIVEDYARAFGKRWQAVANRLLPPNVFPIEAGGLAAKYAVLSLDHLRRECGPAAHDASTYARFAQPARLAWMASTEAGVEIADAVALAAPTLLRFAAPMVPAGEGDPLDLWRTAFDLTYRAELRAERKGRSGSIVEADPARYARFAEAILAAEPALAGPFDAAHRRTAAEGWAHIARRGKRRQLAKLAKASLTYAGGIDYLAWKINRHAGTQIAIRPWQRRWPLLGALTLLPRLIRGGAVR